MTGLKITSRIGVLAVALGMTLSLVAGADDAPFAPPAPTGPYGVGYSRAVLVDQSRAESATGDADDHRALAVQVWYPATVPLGAEAMTLVPEPAQAARMMAMNLDLPLETFDYLNDIKGHSFAGAPVADGRRFPVLVYSHAFGLFSAENSQLMEQLASHGYIIFAIDHPFQAAWVNLGEGKSATFNPAAYLDPDMTPEKGAALEAALVGMHKAADYEGYLSLAREFILGQQSYVKGISLWLDDTDFVIDQLEAKAVPAFAQLYHAMNMERLGVFGMSYGGATAGMTCLHDSRCKAGINIVGVQFGEHDMKFPITVPFMMLNSDQNYYTGETGRGVPVNFEANDFVFHEAKGPVYSLTVADAKHMNFCDLAHLMPEGKGEAFFGSVSPDAVNKVVNTYVLAFFDRYLKGKSTPVLDGGVPEDLPVLEFIQRNTDE
ncbi:alpha/beta hydrolase family protein [Kordiimonas sp.]|uniref:alpha/beta hydrolase family protein n=1 Tax=Kordiimonas sp. TaxID=1970157 RepID=UPI003A902F66